MSQMPEAATSRFVQLPLWSIVRAAASAVLLSSIALAPAAVRAADPSAGQATTSRAAREDAIHSIPFDRLSGEMRSHVSNVVNNASLYRRLPTQTIDCDPELYQFIIRNPEVVVDIWQVMGITSMTLARTAPGHYQAADGQGTVGTVEYAYRSADTQVIYSQGSYDGSLSPARVRGECVVVLKSSYQRGPNGRTRITSRMDAFLRLDNVGIEWVARTLQPLLGKTADHNFIETASFVSSLSHTAETNPAGMTRLSRRLVHVDAQTRQKLAEISVRVADRAEAAQIGMAAEAAAAHVTAATASPAAVRVYRADGEPQQR